MPDEDTQWMERAIELARGGAGLVSPNPMVGAVLVNDGVIVGEGFHLYERLKHGESCALEMAGTSAAGATLYCNLEPCCHHGRTAPCTDGLIEAGIARAVIATQDPDPRVSGRGIRQLREARVQVDLGLCEREALRLNESYFKYASTRLPFVHAVTLRADDSAIWAPWQRSSRFLESVSSYDALVLLGSAPEFSRMVIAAFLSKPRHRDLLVAGSSDQLAGSRAVEMSGSSGSRVTIVRLDSDDRKGEGIASRTPSLDKPAAERRKLDEAIARSAATSVLMIGVEAAETIQEDSIDKMTVITGQPPADLAREMPMALDDVEMFEAGPVIEISGYPHRS